MAKISRYDGNLKAFASEQLGNERTLFGELTFADDLTSQFTQDFLRGWGIISPSDSPSLQDFNAAMYTNGMLSAYLHQVGVAEYNAQQEYYLGSITNFDGDIYVSRANANIGNNPPSSPSSWRSLVSGSVTTLTASAAITVDQLGLVLLSAAGGARNFTLPSAGSANGSREVVLRRTDASANELVISAAAGELIMLDTTATPAGQLTTELLFSGDFLRLRSDGAGKWWCVGQAMIPASISTGYVRLATPGVTQFQVPAILRSGRRLAKVKVTGGGGGGSRRAASPGPSGGGGAGIAEKLIDLSGVQSVVATVGSGGDGASVDGSPGNNGSASSFGGYCSGPAGVGAPNTNSASFGVLGVGGDANYTVGSGSPAVSGPSGAVYGGMGGGGGSPIAAADAARPVNPGSGGGGRTTSNGAPGAHGEIIIAWG